MQNIEKFDEFNDELKLKDLRKLNDEEFLAFITHLRTTTKNFTEFSRVLEEKGQALLLLRCLAGMSRREFAKSIGIHEEILRQIEVGKREIRKRGKLEKINESLREIFSNISVIDLERARELFKEVAVVTENDEVEKIRNELREMDLPEDLREMNEEQFVNLVEWLKEKTNNFKSFPKNLFLAKNQLILILRCAIGMTRPSFARKVGINEETLRFVEMNREENKITTLGIAKRWCEKVTKFLQSNEISFDLEKSLIVWRILKEKQVGEKDAQKEKEIRKVLEDLHLPQDLRDMNEQQFVLLFEKVREITENFTLVPLELITSRSDIILVLRLALGLSRKEFCIKAGIPLGTLRHIERGRTPIRNGGPALRWVKIFSSIFASEAGNITLEKALRAFRTFKGENGSEGCIEMKPLIKMNLEEAKEIFRKVKEETKNFSELSFEKLRREPRIVSVIRVLLNKSIPEFSRIIGKDESWLRRWETGKVKMSLKSSIFLSEKLKELIREIKVSEEVFLENFMELHHVKPSEINENVKKMLKALRKMKATESELEVANLLTELNIPFVLHANVDCKTKVENFDIAIPNEESPDCVIEITEAKKFNGNFRTKMLVTDHKFQILKKALPCVITISFAKINDSSLVKEKAKNMILSEILNTDFLFINEKEELKNFLLGLKEKLTLKLE